jgi:hypothetical protein
MSNSSISVTVETKDMLTQFQSKFGLKTYDNVINTMAVFMIRNEINPKDDFIGDYKIELIRLEKRLLQSFEDAHKKITKDNASLRNWVGGITKDHLIPINEKLSVLDKINDFQIDKFREESFENKKDYNPLNLGENSVQEVSNNSSEIVSEELENQQAKFKDLYSKYDAQKQALFKIFNNSKIESGGMMSKDKIIINLTIEEWNTFQQLL